MSKDVQKAIKQHPCFTNAEDFSTLCSPLAKLGISYFGLSRVDSKHKFAVFSSSPDYLQIYLQKGYFNFDLHMHKHAAKEQYFIWDTVKRHGTTKKLHDELMQLGIGHTFSIIQKSNEYKDIYFFATDINNVDINGLYLQYVDQLKQFIKYFRDKVDLHKSLQFGYELTIDLNMEQGAYLIQTPQLKNTPIIDNKIKRIYVPGKDAYITQREMECLHWIAKGKTAEEVAIILSIAKRTVNIHVDNIKSKLDCRNLFQLGMIYADIQS